MLLSQPFIWIPASLPERRERGRIVVRVIPGNIPDLKLFCYHDVSVAKMGTCSRNFRRYQTDRIQLRHGKSTGVWDVES